MKHARILSLFFLFSTFSLQPCGIALICLRQSLTEIYKQHGNWYWPAHKLYLLMEKQHNRGHDGAGISLLKRDMPQGNIYLCRTRSADSNALEQINTMISKDMNVCANQHTTDEKILKQNTEFLGELYLGHLRYGTHAGHGACFCQPYVRKHHISAKNFALAGNFNLANNQELFEQLSGYGINVTSTSDTQIVLETISFFLDRAYDKLPLKLLQKYCNHEFWANIIAQELDLAHIMHKAAQHWDGGYVFAGILGSGQAFVCRDPAGIRPVFYYISDEVIAAASERSALVSTFSIAPNQVEELKPGTILIIKQDGSWEIKQFIQPLPERQCVFERIYFSRGSDPAIYQERKALGFQVASRVFQALNKDVEHAVFSYIPNTSESAFLGMVEHIDALAKIEKKQHIISKLKQGTLTDDDIQQLITPIRVEKITHKDQMVRTFITQDKKRLNLVSYTYDITRDVVKPDDTLVVIDDSIVRGTTLREAILNQLIRLNPKKIIIVSSAPPILYPDCYGIDMSQLNRFIAFQAAIALLKEQGKTNVIDIIADKCKNQRLLPASRIHNQVKELYDQISLPELEKKIAELVRPKTDWAGEIQIIYQTIEGMHIAIPNYTGDWYFTGDYPTPGGYKVLNTSFLQWYEGNGEARAY